MFVKFLEIFLMWLCLHFSVSDKTLSECKPAVENKGNATELYFLCGFIVLYMLWFSFILGLIFISLCFKLIIIYYHAQKQREIKIKPRIKLNHNIYTT